MSSIENSRALAELINEMVDQRAAVVEPPARIARVESIDTLARTAMIVYLGEDTAVRMPYLGIAPYAVGQEVFVTGPPHNRHITDVKGFTGAEAGLDDFQDEAQIASLRAVVASPYTTTLNANWIPFAFDTVETAQGIESVSASSWRVLVPGLYRVYFRTAQETEDNADYEIRVNKFDNAANTVTEVGYQKIAVNGYYTTKRRIPGSDPPEYEDVKHNYHEITIALVLCLVNMNIGDQFRVELKSSVTLAWSARRACNFHVSRIGKIVA